MKLSELGVKKPIATIMVFVAIFILGAISYTKLAVDMMPEIESPSISVYTRWDGASTEDVEQQITRVMESVLGSVTDLDEITSTTSEGASRVSCKFKWGTKLDEAANDMRDLIERAKRRLPDDADSPVMFKFNTANMPILFCSITCRENVAKMSDLVNDEIVDALKRVPGVGSVEAFGGRERQININLDPDKLSAYGLSVAEIAAAVQAENRTEPAGNVKVGTLDYTIRVPGEFEDPREVGLVVVKRDGDVIVRLSDVAQVQDGFVEKDNIVEARGRDSMMMILQKRSGENTVAVCKRVRARLEEIKETLPADYDIIIVSDSSDSITRSIKSVGQTIIYGGIFVVLTTLIFLRSFRTSLVIALSIPFSLIIAFIFMYALGWTVNIMSLSALAVAIGMVVDNAVVVLENIMSHISRGERRREAAMFGADEVGTAIMASTLTTVVVFLPLVFVTGVSGIIMKQLGGLVSATLCASIFCALYLVPMLGSKLLPEADELEAKKRKRTFGARVKAWLEDRFVALENAYSRSIDKSLRRRWVVVLAAVAVVVFTGFSFTRLGSEFMGTEDTGELSISYELGLGTRYEVAADLGRRIQEYARKVIGDEYIVNYVFNAGGGGGGFGGNRASHTGTVRIKLDLNKKRPKTTDQYAAIIADEVATWPEIVKVYGNSNNFMNRILMGGGANLVIEIYGHDLEVTRGLAERIKDIADETRGTQGVRITQDIGMPELSVKVDRERASSLGLTMYDITTAMSTMFQGDAATQYREGEDEYDIMLRLPEERRSSIEDIRRSEVRLPSGETVRLDSFADVIESSGPVSIRRKNQERVVNVEFDAVDRPQGDIMAEIKERVRNELLIPDGVSLEFGGLLEEQEKSEAAMTMMIILGAVLVYMVMAGQFESLLHPFIIMFSIPFAGSGVAAVLHLTNTPLSMSAYIGIVLLIGIVVNNAIVLIDHINLLRERGVELWKAVVESGRSRLRPVLITTFTTLLGMLPMALSTGDGSATWRPLGLTVVGGLSVSTFVTMYIIPVLYYILESFKIRCAARKKEAVK